MVSLRDYFVNFNLGYLNSIKMRRLLYSILTNMTATLIMSPFIQNKVD